MEDNDLDGETLQLAKSETLALRLKHVGSPTALFFRDAPVKIVRGEGQYLIDERNNRYLDCINNVAHVGHSHPEVTKACSSQISQLCTNSRFLNDNNSICAEKLTSLFPDPLNVCFLVNSGSEANDLALALASSYTKGSDVITLDRAYHGHVKSCLEISPYKWRNLPEDKPDHIHVVSSPDVYRGKYASDPKSYAKEVRDAIENIRKRGKKLSAFIMESLQSCGGQIIPPPGYMEEVFNYVRQAGGVCIVDEVQVGFGRVGSHYWGFQLQGSNVIPDIVTVGKPMGNGHPVSAVITRKEIGDSLKREYFNTFGGNPVSCVIATAVMNIIENENLLHHAKCTGDYLLQSMKTLLMKHEIIGDVRGVGLFLGVEFVKNRVTKDPASEVAKTVYRKMKERYILVSIDGPHNNVMKFKPPMCFNKENVDQLVKALDEVLDEVADEM